MKKTYYEFNWHALIITILLTLMICAFGYTVSIMVDETWTRTEYAEPVQGTVVDRSICTREINRVQQVVYDLYIDNGSYIAQVSVSPMEYEWYMIGDIAFYRRIDIYGKVYGTHISSRLALTE